MKISKRNILLGTAAILIVAVLFIIYSTIDPSTSRFFPRCIFRTLTGFDCPGCGSQRAIHALLSADLAAAWRFNALLVASIPIIILMIIAASMRLRHPRLYNALNSRFAICAWATVIILWWIFRNTPLYPYS